MQKKCVEKTVCTQMMATSAGCKGVDVTFFLHFQMNILFQNDKSKWSAWVSYALWEVLNDYNDIFLFPVLNLTNLTIKGCASKSFCDINFQNSTLGNVYCCSGNLCNASEVSEASEAWKRQDFGLLLVILIVTKLLQ